MIGNDLVDLKQANRDSNWQRKGYLTKIYTGIEQETILGSENPFQLVWVLWSMKEAVYKIHSRKTNTRSFAPTSLVCNNVDFLNNQCTGSVDIENKTYFTKSSLSELYIHTVAAPTLRTLSKVKELIYQNPSPAFDYHRTNPKSVSHHGQYLALVY